MSAGEVEVGGQGGRGKGAPWGRIEDFFFFFFSFLKGFFCSKIKSKKNYNIKINR